MGEPTEPHEDFRRIEPALEGKLVRLRAVEDDDVPRLNEMFSDTEVLRGLQVAFPQPEASAREFYEQSRKSEDTMSFAIETLAGEPIGGCGLHAIDGGSRQARLGIWIGKSHWGKGYGPDAVRVLCRFGFRHMNLHRISLLVYEHNERARRVYERAGFTLEGTMRDAHFADGRYVDVHVMGLLAEELDAT
jgi:RimJ/RimL family protein N-acetyltransferase